MVKHLIKRPVAVFTTVVLLAIAGFFAWAEVPVSLLPDVDVPQLLVRVYSPNTPAMAMEERIGRSLRDGMSGLDGLLSAESQCTDHYVVLHLTFDHHQEMDLAYIEVNERLDRIMNSLPRDIERPQVIRLSTSDIPVLHLQVTPVFEKDYMEVSRLTEHVLKYRLEQLEGLSLVDIHGKMQETIIVKPNSGQLKGLGLDATALIASIQEAGKEIGGISVMDGQLRIALKMSYLPLNESTVRALPVPLKDGTVVPLGSLAEITVVPEKETGVHLFNGRKSIVMTIQKQSRGRMEKVMPAIRSLVTEFEKDYPNIRFTITQDQSFLLQAGMDNLQQDLIYGGILTIALLFLFLGNWRSPLLMSISIPLSLLFTCILFYVFGLSFNIISLSGMALGVGMLIDNSIVVVDNITRKRLTGAGVEESCIKGTGEVVAPVISQVLTTVAVYAPLIILNGMAGALLFDQSIALTIVLFVSLLIAFILVPLLYRLIMKPGDNMEKEDTAAYKWLSIQYHRMITYILRHRSVFLPITLCLMPLGIWLGFQLPIQALPVLEQRESLLKIIWDEPVDIRENIRRIQELLKVIQPHCLNTEADAGTTQFLLQKESKTGRHAEVYIETKNEELRKLAEEKASIWMAAQYGRSIFQTEDAGNAFTQLFKKGTSFIEAKFRYDQATPEQVDSIPLWLKDLEIGKWAAGPGFSKEPQLSVQLDETKMAVYGVNRNDIQNILQQQFGRYTIAAVKRQGAMQHILLQGPEEGMDQKLNALVESSSGISYPINTFLSFRESEGPRYILADRRGAYKAILLQPFDGHEQIRMDRLRDFANQHKLTVNFSGTYFESREQLKLLSIAFLAVLLLLYFILAIQYESLVYPLLVMLTIPLGITGGMFLLWISGGGLDVMAATGFIVVLGLIVDDPILKLEVLRRISRQHLAQGGKIDEGWMMQIIHEAGEICLKPLLMVSLTTSVALIPVLFLGGIGNDLQRPLCLVIIGGLTIGTFFTTWFIPLAYYYLMKCGVLK